MSHESLLVGILLGHGDPVDIAAARMFLALLLAAPVVLFAMALISSMAFRRTRKRHTGYRYDRTYRLPRDGRR